MNKQLANWVFRFAMVVILVALPLIISWIYSSLTAMPTKVRLGTGPQNGRYRQIMESLKGEIETELGIEVELVETGGSFDNLELLQKGEIDFALFQAGSDQDENLTTIAEKRQSVSFVANLYPEVTHLLVSHEWKSRPPREWVVERIALSMPATADASLGEILIQHFGIQTDGKSPQHKDYTELAQAFSAKQIDVAILQVGVQAPVVRRVLESGECELMSVPNRNAFLTHHVAFSAYEIPTGIYRVNDTMLPATEVQTVSVSAQLLCRPRIHTGLCQKITEMVHRPDFAKRNELQEIFGQGPAYSRSKPEFPIHRGATRFYNPATQPWLNTEFVERTEGIRSFGFSVLIGCFFLVRWLLKWRTRSVEHQLDRYIHSLLEIEQKQMKLDFDTTDETISKLEAFLDQVTDLRREALTEFTAHQLNDDPAITCFLDMSHALSEKISSKLTRNRIGQLGEKL